MFLRLKIILCPAVEPSHSEEMQKPFTFTNLSKRPEQEICRSLPWSQALLIRRASHLVSVQPLLLVFLLSRQRTTRLFLYNKSARDVKRAHELSQFSITSSGPSVSRSQEHDAPDTQCLTLLLVMVAFHPQYSSSSPKSR